MTAEDDRAAEWRAQQRRRAVFAAENAKRLRGSAAARAALETKWSAVIYRTQSQPEDSR